MNPIVELCAKVCEQYAKVFADSMDYRRMLECAAAIRAIPQAELEAVLPEEAMPIRTEFFWLIEMKERSGGVFYWPGTYEKELQYWDWSANAYEAVRFPSKLAAEMSLQQLNLNYVYIDGTEIRLDKIYAAEHGFSAPIAALPKAEEAVARPTIKVRRGTPEYARYLKARFPLNDSNAGTISFQWNGKRYSYQYTDFDDAGEFDVLLCAAPAALPDGDDPIVGHKTLRDGSHVPLRKREADALLARIEASDQQRKASMPDEQSAINALFNAWLRLKDFGWNDACYCPKDGSMFSVLEAGSTGIHEAHYQGEWPNGCHWIHADGDLWPSRPILFKSLLSAATGEKK